MSDPRRRIPAVDRLLASDAFAALLRGAPRDLVASGLREVQRELRRALAGGSPPPAGLEEPAWYAERTTASLERLRQPSLRPVINATGVVLHTNLGRAPLADVAVEAMVRIAAGYSNLEYSLADGRRGSRYDHCAGLLARLSGAEAALVVNNNAAALVLALNTFAREREAVISRGELIEIGGSFRVPEIMERSGARMVEVGATNRTHLHDYAEALSQRSGALVKVHRSNFQVSGYTAEVPAADLVQLARARAVPFIHDLGSGLFLPPASLGLPDTEVTAADGVAAGATVVTMSGDKLLGGPQAGIVLGTREAIDAMRHNPLCRAFRVDRLTLAALEATLALYLDTDRAMREIPVLRMLVLTPPAIESRAVAIAEALRNNGIEAGIQDGVSAVGGGAFPGAELPTTLVAVTRRDVAPHVLDARLRSGEPAVVVRVAGDRTLIDPRTVAPSDDGAVIEAVCRAFI